VWRYIGLRLVQLVPVIVIASVAVWLMIYLVPGDPAVARVGAEASPEQLAIARREIGLDQPLPVQYARWLFAAVRGDLGLSIATRVPVLTLLSQRIPATLHLAVASMLIAALIALPVALFAAVRPNGWFARMVALYVSLTLAVPTFWLGILMVLAFGVWLRLVPSSGYVAIWDDPVSAISHLILPALALGMYISGVLIRFLRTALQEALDQDYVRTARSKGLSEPTVVRRHALRNALIPAVTVIALHFGSFLGGAVVTEAVFNYPGIGRLILDAVILRDYSVVQGAILMVVITFSLLNLTVDVLYRFLDPRIRYQ
jgi:peptide/nickel transport system permease protein